MTDHIKVIEDKLMKDKSIIELLGEVKTKLEDAKTNMEDWASYASDYSKDKWNFDGDIKELDDGITTLTEVMERLPQYEETIAALNYLLEVKREKDA